MTANQINQAKERVRLAASQGYDAYMAARRAWEMAVAEHPQMVTMIERLRDLLDREPGRVYVRWSSSERLDRQRGHSIDHQTGQAHAGLSAVRVERDWLDDPAYLVRRLAEYQSPGNPIGYILVGDRVGTDTDGYESVRPTGEPWITLPRCF